MIVDRYHALAIGGMLAMAGALGIGRFVYTPILPAMIEDLNWSKSDAGLVASANFLGYLFGALAATRSHGLLGPRALLLAALTGSAVTTAGMATGGGLAAFTAFRFVGGVASAYVIVIGSLIVLDRLSASGRGRLSSAHFAGVGAGIMVSALVVSGLMAIGAGWRHLWLASGALALVATLAVGLLIRDEPHVRASGDRMSKAAPAKVNARRALMLLIIAYGSFGFGYVITTTFLVTIVRLTPALGGLEAWIWILFGFAAVPSVPFWAWLAARVGLMTAFATACLAEAVGVLASILWISPTGIVVSAILIGGTFMGLTALGLMGARQLADARSQSAIGAMTASFAIGQMIGPVLAGYLFDHTGGFEAASALAILALLLAALLAYVVGRLQNLDRNSGVPVLTRGFKAPPPSA